MKQRRDDRNACTGRCVTPGAASPSWPNGSRVAFQAIGAQIGLLAAVALSVPMAMCFGLSRRQESMWGLAGLVPVAVARTLASSLRGGVALSLAASIAAHAILLVLLGPSTPKSLAWQTEPPPLPLRAVHVSSDAGPAASKTKPPAAVPEKAQPAAPATAHGDVARALSTGAVTPTGPQPTGTTADNLSDVATATPQHTATPTPTPTPSAPAAPTVEPAETLKHIAVGDRSHRDDAPGRDRDDGARRDAADHHVRGPLANSGPPIRRDAGCGTAHGDACRGAACSAARDAGRRDARGGGHGDRCRRAGRDVAHGYPCWDAGVRCDGVFTLKRGFWRLGFGEIRDPVPNCEKNFLAEWRCGDATFRTAPVTPRSGEGYPITLSCPGA